MARALQGFGSIYVTPSNEFSDLFVKDRINPCIHATGLYQSIQGDASAKTVRLKHFNQRGVRFAGANVRSNFFGFATDTAIIDEINLCDQANLSFVADRLQASENPKWRRFGNPTFKGDGIDRLFRDSDGKEWHIKCQHCGEWQVLDLFVNVVRQSGEHDFEPLDTDWEPGREMSVMCRKCGRPIDRLSRGEWVAAHPENEASGYHISRIFADGRRHINVVESLWLLLQLGLSDPIAMQNLMNSHLGLAYTAGDVAITAEMLERCVLDGWRGSESRPDDDAVNAVVMGVDVGGVLHFKVSALVQGTDGKMRRKTLKIGHCGWSELPDIINQYDVDCGVIDRNPEREKVDELLLSFPQFWACEYYLATGMDDIQVDEISRLVKVDRTRSLDRSFTAVKQLDNLMPLNFRYIDNGDFLAQMEAPTRVLSETGVIEKKVRYVWTEGNQADHYRHADNYEFLAGQLMGEMKVVDFL